MTSKELAAAARYIDELAEKRGLAGSIESLGLSLDDVLYVCNQRALRAILMMRGDPNYARLKKVTLSPEEQRIEAVLKCAHLDGLCIGMAAARGLSAPLQTEGHHREN